ncbi:hypothetical protein O6H91_14G072600 [Diphasiastrum complanatum]|uniref:Uncharacterized protein n=1 Tax=Diphasiastrum complanatum TaxID=34168 RepID=A0ACC2BQS5_DIPCM|nr:hypothetical protein O6H91_14G072600 [Diphasiastrum complanatum]
MEDHFPDIFGGHDTKEVILEPLCTETGVIRNPEIQLELRKISSFVKSEIKRKTEKFAIQNDIVNITLEIFFTVKEFS